MSFRVRVLALVVLVAATAVGATAYLAFRQAARQVNETVTTSEVIRSGIVDAMVTYGRVNGSWTGIEVEAARLAEASGQRIRLTTGTGEVVVDTDAGPGREPRPANGPPILVDPRLRLKLPTGSVRFAAAEATLRQLLLYRQGLALAACLTRAGLDVSVTQNPYGVPEYQAGVSTADTAQARRCALEAAEIGVSKTERGQALACPVAQPRPDHRNTGSPALNSCLEAFFAKAVADGTPPPLQLYLGVAGAAPAPLLTPGPVIAAAAVVIALTVGATVLLSRRVVRPIAVLTAASRRLGDGDLSGRVPVRGRDELAQLAGSFNRMADSLQAGEERQKRLVADVAHELRTPLANLRGYLEALKDGVLPADLELFANLHREAVLQQRIVDDLQDLALAEAGTLAYHRTTVDLSELLETCYTAHQAAVEAAGVDLRMRTDRDLLVDADPDRLRQVIGNLVGNALRATPSGGSITLGAAGGGNGTATVMVRDTGVGIAPEELPHIFDRFWRADAARGRTNGGSGLGLAIARQIITDHNGHIVADSRPGEGTTVTITLPLRSHAAGSG